MFVVTGAEMMGTHKQRQQPVDRSVAVGAAAGQVRLSTDWKALLPAQQHVGIKKIQGQGPLKTARKAIKR